MRHRSIALPLAALASLALASVAVAGGWAQVTAKNVPVDPPAGAETTIEVDVLQHGVTPVSWPGLTVIATDATSGTVVRAEAQATGSAGSYVATIVFPSAGEWSLTFASTDLEMEGSVAMHVAPPVGAAPAGAGTPGESAPVTPASDVLPLVLVLLVAAVILAIGGLALRSRGGSAGSRVSAGT
jgi:hypothetical protein